ncbi:MAG TPA: hypothetical protein PK808_03800 [Polymorphobacter sp.]|nr:hypothetical protein [Polymorphobacter sp.]
MVTRDTRDATASLQRPVSIEQRAAFIAALGRCGKVVEAAAACGLVLTKLYRARRKFADFAADWDAVLAARPVQSRPGDETWSTATQTRFFEVLAQSGSPAQAAAAVGRSLAGAYRLRQNSARFAAAWTQAQELALDLIEAAVAERALAGVRPAAARGTQNRQRVEHSDRLAIFMLKALRPEKFNRPRGTLSAPAAPKFTRAQLIARFRELSRRIAREDAAAKGQHGPSATADQRDAGAAA